MPQLYISMQYEVNTDLFDIVSNIKNGELINIICEFVRSQIGLGSDESAAIEKDSYCIRINLDLNGDEFTVKHDCGNVGLMLGIIMHYLEKQK